MTFPTGSDTASQLARIDASLVTLQNLNGSGVGCPAASTTFSAQQAAILAGTTAPAAAAAAPAASQTSAAVSTASSDAGGVNVALVPQFDVTANTNPDGEFDCSLHQFQDLQVVQALAIVMESMDPAGHLS